MKTKSIFTFILLLTTIFFYGQSKKVADRYFSEYSYIQSAKLYKDLILIKGDTSKHVLSRLADSYYNNADTDEAEIWYKKLVTQFKDNIDDKHLFKYAQVLRSNGKYKKSDSIFLILSINDKYNNREKELNKGSYLLDYSNLEKRIGVRNLGINTKYSDFGGFLLNGQSYFSSSSPDPNLKKQKLYKWNNQPFLNIFKADASINSLEAREQDTVLTLSNKEKLEVPIVSEFHESTPIFTKDGKTIYFTRNNSNGKKAKRDKKNSSNLKLFSAKFVEGYWVNVKELPFNDDEYSVGHPALSNDEKTLYFVSNMPGGIGDSDIYKVEIKGNNEYGKPKNLGDKINTSSKEFFPFIGKDNTLYFSSNGHLGLGLLDIFQSKILTDSTFSAPKNLGQPFNSKKDDFSFYIHDDGIKGFFSSNRLGGKGDDDIYSFYIYTDQIICKQNIDGIVTNSITNDPIKSATVKLINDKDEIIEEINTDNLGYYQFKNVLCNTNFTIVASKLDHKQNQVLAVTTAVINNTIKKDITLTPLIIGDQIVIKPIYFDYDKDFIREDAQYELENIVTVMTNHPEIVINIESHTDSRGRKAYNRDLSDRRAKSTRDFIISRGISKERINSAIGYGEDRLLNDCNDANKNKCTKEEHQLNRRSYFYIIKGANEVKLRQQKSSELNK